MDELRHVVVQVREGDAVLCPDRLSDDDLVDVVELVPVLVPETYKTCFKTQFRSA